MAQRQSIYYVLKVSMMVDNCTHNEHNPQIHFWYITTTILNLWQNDRHECYILGPSQGIFYMQQVPSVVDNCTKYKQNQPIPFWAITTNA